jgi:hypothetical protein
VESDGPPGGRGREAARSDHLTPPGKESRRPHSLAGSLSTQQNKRKSPVRGIITRLIVIRPDGLQRPHKTMSSSQQHAKASNDPFGGALPHNIEAEQCLLGAILRPRMLAATSAASPMVSSVFISRSPRIIRTVRQRLATSVIGVAHVLSHATRSRLQRRGLGRGSRFNHVRVGRQMMKRLAARRWKNWKKFKANIEKQKRAKMALIKAAHKARSEGTPQYSSPDGTIEASFHREGACAQLTVARQFTEGR